MKNQKYIIGVPKDIIKNSYDEIIEYYKQFYNPNNVLFYSYGDLDFT
jgi:Zn-dependent M16 (insulinase) family peptidase